MTALTLEEQVIESIHDAIASVPQPKLGTCQFDLSHLLRLRLATPRDHLEVNISALEDGYLDVGMSEATLPYATGESERIELADPECFTKLAAILATWGVILPLEEWGYVKT